MFFLFIVLSNFFLKSVITNSVNFHVTFLLFLDLLKGLLNILRFQLINVFMNHSTLSCLFIDIFYRFMNFFLLHLFISSLAHTPCSSFFTLITHVSALPSISKSIFSISNRRVWADTRLWVFAPPQHIQA